MSSSKYVIMRNIVILLTVIFTTNTICDSTPVFSKIEKLRSISKRHAINLSNRDTESTSLESCRESLVCGHAYYDSSYTITSYRKSNRCICDEGYRCVLTNNLSDRKAYVFKCRSFDQSENMFPFPEHTSTLLWFIRTKVWKCLPKLFCSYERYSSRIISLLSTSLVMIYICSCLTTLPWCWYATRHFSLFLIIFLISILQHVYLVFN